MQLVARANLIFGLHVHVGIEDRETAIHLMNQMRYFLPHLLALSANSPFWIGLKTGLKSYRCKVFDKFPRTNIPDTFTSWADFDDRLVHFRLDALVELALALGNDLGVDVRAQIEGDGIDGLVFLFDADGEGRLHERSWQLTVSVTL